MEVSGHSAKMSCLPEILSSMLLLLWSLNVLCQLYGQLAININNILETSQIKICHSQSNYEGIYFSQISHTCYH